MQKQLAELMTTLNKNQRLSKLAISEKGFLFDPETGQSFTLNYSGMQTLNHLKRGESLEDTAKHLADEFKIPHDTALNSIEAFLIQLGRYI
ncbi:MAG: PqqD family protein [Candidatus Obscuribacterales bacterium]|nr:PqqD family protein [Candidatus Obscuribacterales bacterium]